MNPIIFKTAHTDETSNLAMKVAALLKPGYILTLEGDLGTGKTTFTKGLAKGLGIKRNVNSPTFTIIKEYTDGSLPLYHMDVYRLEDSDEDLGFDEYFNGNGVTVVEWAHLIKDQLPLKRLDIKIIRSGDDYREIIFNPKGPEYVEMCKGLTNESFSN